jgi:hypothetical protein
MITCHVKIDERTFVVTADTDGNPIRIKERKLYMPGTFMECWFNAPFWPCRNKGAPRPGSLTDRIIQAAKAKLS